MESLSRHFLGLTLVIAILLHLLVLSLPIGVGMPGTEHVKKQDTEKDAIIVEKLDPKDSKPIVQTSPSDEENSEAKPKFWSDRKNRVKEETQSPFKGTFQEGLIVKGRGAEASEENNSDKIGAGEGSSLRKGDPHALLMQDLMQFGRTPNALSEDIKKGGGTVLNTDKVLYASFINRIAEEVYDPWVSYGQRALKEVLAQGRKVEPNTFITKLGVTMNSNGEILGISVIQSSGLQELDEAPKKAFWQIARFANPPSQLFDGDGFVRLTYEFQFEWKTAYFNIVPWQI